jgi:hypothetical protein
MDVTPADRDELVRRVMRRVGRARVRASLVRETVDRVLEALPAVTPPGAAASRVVVIHRASTPDLASRLRAAAPSVVFLELHTVTEGRHAVVVARVAADDATRLQEVARGLGATCSVREDA